MPTVVPSEMNRGRLLGKYRWPSFLNSTPRLCYLLSVTHCQLGPDDVTSEEEQGSATYLETQRLRSVTTPSGVCTHGCGYECMVRELLGFLRMKLASSSTYSMASIPIGQVVV